jgi:glycosyltransferase involved in cell wall biosynthesis
MSTNSLKMKNINIYFNQIVPEPARSDGRTGAVIRSIQILKRLKNQEAEIKIEIRTTKWMADYYRENGLDVDYKIIGPSLKFKSQLGLFIKAFFLTLKSYSKFIIPKSKNADEKNVVYATSDLFWEVIPAYVSKMKNRDVEWVQIIHHVYSSWKERPGSKVINLLGQYAQRFSFFLIRRKADKIILVNHLIKSELVKIGFKEEKIFISSNGIDFEYFEKLGKGYFSYDGIFLGRLSASKGIYDLIAIWKKVVMELPSAKLAVIGGGEKSTKEDLQKKIIDAGLQENIKLTGFLKDGEAHNILKSGKIFIFPSHEEGWGIAVAEAMACGLPTVSWNLPVYKDVFEDCTFQIKENDIAGFSEKIIKLLNDENERTKIGQKGREFIKKYSWDSVAQKELEIINS